MVLDEKYTEILRMITSPKKVPIGFILNTLLPGEFIIFYTFLDYERANNGRHITVNELAEKMEVSVPAVSRSLRIMEEKEYITRVTDPSCRRNTFIVITEKGRKMFEENNKLVKKLIDAVFEELSDEEIEQAMRLHQRICSVVDRKVKTMLN